MVHGSMRIGAVYMAGVLAGNFLLKQSRQRGFNYLFTNDLFLSPSSSSPSTGSLGTSVFDTDVYLVGASGGVYALLAAHLANVLLVINIPRAHLLPLSTARAPLRIFCSIIFCFCSLKTYFKILIFYIFLLIFQNYNNMEFGVVRLIGIFIVASADVGFAIYDRYAAEQIGPPVSYVAHLTGALAGLTIGLLVLKNFEQKLHEQLIWWVALGVYAACTLFAILFNVFNPEPYQLIYPTAV